MFADVLLSRGAVWSHVPKHHSDQVTTKDGSHAARRRVYRARQEVVETRLDESVTVRGAPQNGQNVAAQLAERVGGDHLDGLLQSQRPQTCS